MGLGLSWGSPLEIQAEVRQDGEPLGLRRRKSIQKGVSHLTEQTRENLDLKAPAPEHPSSALLQTSPLGFVPSPPGTTPRLLSFAIF